MQVEAGVQGVSPGPSTEKFLTAKMKAVRLWGALSVAVLAVIAQYFDMYCLDKIGTSISSLSLLLVAGLITSCIRQVWYEPPTAVQATCTAACHVSLALQTDLKLAWKDARKIALQVCVYHLSVAAADAGMILLLRRSCIFFACSVHVCWVLYVLPQALPCSWLACGLKVL